MSKKKRFLNKLILGFLIGLFSGIFCSIDAFALNVPLTVRDYTGVDRVSEPVTSGVPLPKGLIFSDQSVQIQGVDGQFKTLATWPDGSIKWLLCDFQANVPANESSVYHLIDGSGNVSSTSLATETAEYITVITGPLKFTVSKNNFNLFDEVWIDRDGDEVQETKVVDSQNLDGGHMVNAVDITYYTSTIVPNSVTIEENGPLRTVIKAEGRYATNIGETDFLYYVIRIYAYKNKSYVRVFNTFTDRYDTPTYSDPWHSPTQTVKDISVVTTLSLQGSKTYLFGGTNNISGTLNLGENTYIYQDTSSTYSIHKPSGTVTGTRFSGFADLSDSEKGLTVAVRNFWENFPKSIDLNYTGKVTIGLWPSFTSTTFNIPVGMAKTHEILYYFHNGGITSTELNNCVKSFNDPLLALASAQWYVDSNTLGKFVPYDLINFANYETLQGWAVDLNITASIPWYQTQRNAYGLKNFGDYCRAVATDDWGNMEVDLSQGMFMQFVRTGNKSFFNYFHQQVMHSMDIDAVHGRPWTTEKYNRNHHGPGTHHTDPSPKMEFTYCRGLFDYYYLTGYKRVYEVALELADGQAWQVNNNASAFHYGERRAAWAIVDLVEAYKATWDSKYLNSATTAVNLQLTLQDSTTGAFTYHNEFIPWVEDAASPWMTGLLFDGLISYYEVTKSTTVRDSIIKAVDWLKNYAWREQVLQANAYNNIIGAFLYLWRYEETPGSVTQPYDVGGSNYTIESFHPPYNFLIVNGFAFAYEHTGNQTYMDLATKAFNYGVSYNCYPYGGGNGFQLLDVNTISRSAGFSHYYMYMRIYSQIDESSGGDGGGGGGCLIATAVYDSPMVEEILVLSKFRDKYLLTNKLGRVFIELYNKFSPTIAKYIEKREWAKRVVRGMSKPVVWFAKKMIE